SVRHAPNRSLSGRALSFRAPCLSSPDRGMRPPAVEMAVAHVPNRPRSPQDVGQIGRRNSFGAALACWSSSWPGVMPTPLSTFVIRNSTNYRIDGCVLRKRPRAERGSAPNGANHARKREHHERLGTKRDDSTREAISIWDRRQRPPSFEYRVFGLAGPRHP